MNAGSITRLAIADIAIGQRHRRDMGNIEALAASIGEVGLLHPPVVTPDGRLIAGERRLRACQQLGWSDIPVTVVDLEAVVKGECAENFARKDFTPSEIVAIRRTLEPLIEQMKIEAKERQGRPDVPRSAKSAEHGTTRDLVANFVGMARTSLKKAEAVVVVAEQNPDDQRIQKIKDTMDATGNIDRAFKQVQIIDRQAEHANRVESGCTVSDLEALAASGKRFAAILADPPWPWETFGPLGRIRSCPDHHYGLSTLDEIRALPVAQLAAENAVLAIWSTWALLPVALQIIEAWGFIYKTAAFVWVKMTSAGNLHTGMGYWTRSNTEFALLATKGAPKRLVTDVHEVVQAAVGEHSEKPEEVRRRIERLVEGPYLELYGRRPVEGWTVWGDEVAPPTRPPEMPDIPDFLRQSP